MLAIQRATMTAWRTSSCSDCRHGEHSYHVSSGIGLERTKPGDAFVIGREEQTVYILEVDIGERAGTVTINRQKARLTKRSKFSSNKVCPGLWRIPHAKRPVTGSCGDSNVIIEVPVYLINPTKS